MMYDLSGKVALVTGASSGLGARFAKLLAGQGARVVVGARRRDRLDDVVAAIGEAGGEALAVELDVADEASTMAAYDAAESEFGPVDIVVANAGMSVDGSALEVSVKDFDRLMSVNLRGVFLTVREGARRLIANGSPESGNGRIVIISSITAHSVSPGLSIYSGSKAGVLQMGKVLARDWVNKGINVNMVCPGYIETEINADWFATDYGKKQISRWPRKRLMEAGGLDSMLLYLASDESRYTTGSVFTLDDGQTL